MSFFSGLFHSVLYQPFFNGFVSLYAIIPDVGVVILIITVIIKVALYPLTGQSIKAQKAMTELQPKIAELKKKYKDDQQQLAQETMKLYKEHQVNPLGSCLPILVQLPVFIALYWVLRDIFSLEVFEHVLYSFVPHPASINPYSFGIINLGQPSVILALCAAAGQFWQARFFANKRAKTKTSTATNAVQKSGKKDSAAATGSQEEMMAMVQKQMLYVMPFMTLLIGMQLAGGLALYWCLSTVITGVQQLLLFRKKSTGSATNGGVIEGEVTDKK